MKDINQRLNSGILDIKPYEPGKTVSEASLERKGTDFIKLASNENPFGMSPRALQAIRERAAEAFAYPEVSCREAREALAEKYGLDPDQVIFGNGGDGLIYACALTLINQDDEAIIPEITFPYYEIAVRAMRGHVIYSKMKNLEIDLEDILARLTPRTKMIWLANPNNPTGSVINKAAFAEFLRRVPDDVFLIHDEVYADYADRNDFPDTFSLIRGGKENLFLIRSFSKIYGMAGVRIGYGVGAQSLVKLMYRVRPPFDVSVLAQIAGTAALGDDQFYKMSIEHNEREKLYLSAELKKRSLEFLPTSTNFILINVRENARSLVDRLLARGVIVRALSHPSLSGHIRLTIGTRPQNKRFLKVLDAVKEAPAP